MSSAQGVVQDLGYKATFPLLLNISSQPTYFMALKDSAGLVKGYAMVNLRQYQVVATGSSVADTQTNYIKLLVQKGIVKEEVLKKNDETGVIAEIRTAVRSGTSFYYIRLEGDNYFYVISVAERIIGAIRVSSRGTIDRQCAGAAPTQCSTVITCVSQ